MSNMAIHSYTQPSTSDSSGRSYGRRDGSRIAIKEYGLMKECYCGARAIIDTCHSQIDPGRRFYTCPNVGDGDSHIWKWWDEAVMEELSLMGVEAGEVAEKMDLFTYLDDLYMATQEIKQLKGVEIETTKKIAMMEMELAEMKKKRSGFEMQDLL
ncbi:unnamed protein product [Thlaspi arvense]|uniref:Zinc finger GRF-type domain-containing protein n=1 Tax=Thlaspi arvense TaxID=13288 RepID=A0AAU9S046_THLAR|nr:unnamed protein product [Thlaspi arvense]